MHGPASALQGDRLARLPLDCSAWMAASIGEAQVCGLLLTDAGCDLESMVDR
ncbi:hypothetical protein [Kibdelosporangium philippinense]|uniref:hypothetical protein n=1 Tax=Kibdelosporangium philippinense TaxID=211113 RepID=UPI0036181253